MYQTYNVQLCIKHTLHTLHTIIVETAWEHWMFTTMQKRGN